MLSIAFIIGLVGSPEVDTKPRSLEPLYIFLFSCHFFLAAHFLEQHHGPDPFGFMADLRRENFLPHTAHRRCSTWQAEQYIGLPPEPSLV